jgi:hypothetical protein
MEQPIVSGIRQRLYTPPVVAQHLVAPPARAVAPQVAAAVAPQQTPSGLLDRDGRERRAEARSEQRRRGARSSATGSSPRRRLDVRL